MKKRMMALLLAGLLAGCYGMSVTATEGTEQTAAEDTDDEAAEEGVTGEGAADSEVMDGIADSDAGDSADTAAAIVIPKGNMVDVGVIDLALHAETTGDRTPVYAYENPFQGKDTSKGAVIEFYAKPTWDLHVLGTIFAFNGSGAYDGKLYFTPGSYLGFNSEGFGGITWRQCGGSGGGYTDGVKARRCER